MSDLVIEISEPYEIIEVEDGVIEVIEITPGQAGAGGGSGVASVTSQEVSALIASEAALRSTGDNALSAVLSAAVSALSQSLSVEQARAISAEAALSVRIDGTGGSGAGSVTSQELSTAAAGLSGRIDVVSNAASVVSQALSAEIAARTSADNALSNKISAVSSDISVQISAKAVLRADGSFSTFGPKPSALEPDDRFLIEDSGNSFEKRYATLSNIRSALSVPASVTSQDLSAAATGLSGRIDTQSDKISILSQQASVLSARVAGNSAQMTSADNSLSSRIDGVSNALSVSFANVNADISTLRDEKNAVSQALSAKKLISLADISGTPSDGQIPQWNSAAGKFQFSTIAVGTGSVLSNELSAASAAAASADATLSGRIDVVSNAASVISQALSAEIANRISADNVLSNKISVLSVDVSLQISAKAITRADGSFSILGPKPTDIEPDDRFLIEDAGNSFEKRYVTFSNLKSAMSIPAAGSVTSQELSVAAAALSVRIDTQSQGISALSQNLSANSVVLSNTQSAVQANSAQMTSADNANSAAAANALSVANAASNAVSVEIGNRTSADNALSARIDTQSQGVSVLSQQVSGLSVRVATNSAQMVSADNAISNAVSIVSVAVSAEISNRISADNALSVRIDTQSQGISVLSQQVSVLSANVAGISVNVSAMSTKLSNVQSAVQANSAQMTSADNAISNALSVEISNRTSADNVLSVRVDTQSQGISVLSQQISALSQALSAKKLTSLADVSGTPADGQIPQWNSAAGKFQFSTIAAGTGSVTSNELSAVSAAAASADASLSARIDTVSNANSVVSQALSAAIVDRISADNLLSTRIDTQSQGISVLSQQVSGLSVRVATNSAQMVSADNAISNAVSVEIANRTSADNVLSTRIDTVSNVASVISQALSAAIADRISADNALSNKISALSNDVSLQISAKAVTRADGSFSVFGPKPTDLEPDDRFLLEDAGNNFEKRYVTFSNFKSALSIPAGGTGSVTSQELSVAAAALSVRIDTVSNAASVADAHANTVSAAVVNKTISSLAGVSIPAPSDGQALVWNSAAGQWVASTIAGGAGSVTSTELSAASAAAQSANNILSARIDSVQSSLSTALSAISALSQANSASQAALSVRIDTQSQGISALSAYTNRAIGSEFDGGIASTTSLVINFANGRAQKLSIVANTPIAAPTGLSAGGRYVLRIVQDATGNRQPTWAAAYVWPNSVAPTLGGANAIDILAFYSDGTNLYGNYNAQASALLQTLSVLSQQISTLSNQVSVLSNNVSVLNNNVSALSANVAALSNQVSATGAFQRTTLLSIVTISATALTNIPALSLTLSAGVIYQVEGMLLYSFSGVSSGNAGIGMTFPALASINAGGYIEMGQQGQQATASAIRRGYWTHAGSGSTIVSGFTATTSGLPYVAEIRGIMEVSATGSWQIRAKATSAGAGAIHFLRGSHIKTYKIG